VEVSDAPSIAGPGHNLASTEDIIKDRYESLFREIDAIAAEANAAKAELGEAVAVQTDDQRDALTAIGIKAKKLAKRVGETRLAHTKPMRDEIDETNRIFGAYATRADRIVVVFEGLVGAYDRRKRDEEKRRAAEEAKRQQEEAQRKLEEAAQAEHSVVGDVILDEAEQAQQRALEAQARVQLAGKGPTRTDAGTISQSAPWTFRIVDVTKIPLDELRPYLGVDVLEKALRAFVRANKGARTLPGVEFFQETKTTFRG
jgi:hypothetical protein